ncbi:uncharacterized protein FA14DRAFT_191394 [Meira miltonrushii]|uniref:Uncharacterized protein n=1 Tax=Meira miltonrushii TaxID=1280837 RepID=A0A316VFR8_9BASI|nr:uncharacterized protein FA14DRAFT_191394 [Meira miltonrushii]PWN34325.1 hypothetical protein FA14DRAFT_191394 [Meira miltonrushii]
MPPKKSDSTASPANSEKRTRTPSRRRSSTGLKAKAKKAAGPSRVKALRTVFSSKSKYVHFAGYAVGVLFIAFGLLDFINPKLGASFFEIDYPILPKQQIAVDALVYVVGARDLFIGASLILALYFANRQTTAYLFLLASSQAILDGAICFFKVGKGHLNHWSYAPLVAFIGAILTGSLDI